jgi:spore germination protein KA
MDGLASTTILADLLHRFETFEIDGVLDVNYLNELIRDAPLSPFKTIGITERPDVVVGKLLEGRIAVFLDGTPVVLTLPYLFIENFQSSEDYYLNFYYTSVSRFLRILSFLITIIVPAFYVSMVNYHPEMLPTPFIISVVAARQGVPFPVVIECFGMLVMFQLLAEAGIRMPPGIGQALSIVGALVIGQAAVEARIVGAPMVIIVAITGITGLMIPKLNGANLLLRLFLLALASMMGLYGLLFGLVMHLIHLLDLESFGVPYVSDIIARSVQKNKDLAIRLPWWKMLLRPDRITDNRVRLKGLGGKNP